MDTKVCRFASAFNQAEFDSLAREAWPLDEWLPKASSYLEARGSKLLGQGMGRIVYSIASDRAIKLAMSQFGREQNQQEEYSYDDHRNLGILLPVLDAADDGRWIISPLVKPAKRSDLEKAFGAPLSTIDAAIDGEVSVATSELTDAGKKLVYIAQKEKLVVNDLLKLDSWGVWHGKVWLMDYGLSKSIAKSMMKNLYRMSSRVAVRFKNRNRY